MAREEEIDIEEIQSSLAGMSPQEQTGLDNWLATQRFLAHELGLEMEQWYEYLQWAFRNPCDFSMIQESREAALAKGGGDSLVKGSRGEQAAAALGAKKELKLPGGGGLGNLLGMVAAGKKEREEKK